MFLLISNCVTYYKYMSLLHLPGSRHQVEGDLQSCSNVDESPPEVQQFIVGTHQQKSIDRGPHVAKKTMCNTNVLFDLY